MLIGVLTVVAGSIEVNAAAVPAEIRMAALPSGRDAAANHHANGVPSQYDAPPALLVSSEDAPQLASLDPSQFVYEYVQGPPKSASVLLSGVSGADGRLFPLREVRLVPHHRPRTAGDFVLMGCVALMLVAYQLRRKHRFLRPHPFGL
jgi:hypothetical protein